MMTRAIEWATDYLRDHPEVVLVRLGHGHSFEANGSFAWVGTITTDGEHREVPPTADVWRDILDNVPLEQWVELKRSDK